MSAPIRAKTSTDEFWDRRAVEETDKNQVNLPNLAQRELENDFIFKHISHDSDVLEIGCGNGYLTQQLRENIKFVTAFDFSESMIQSAIELWGEKNNKFYVDDLLNPKITDRKFDFIICLRVLINLKNFEEQCAALENMKRWLKSDGKLILIEGFLDGFNNLNRLRKNSELKDLCPAEISYYSPLENMLTVLEKDFTILDTMHIGSFDYLTRIIYPALTNEEEIESYSDFHKKILTVSKVFNPKCMEPFSRLRGFLLSLKA